ncbi:MAG: ADP-ribosylglycohydrolase family protein [Desulfobacterales bacterium]|nr:ADP-ribosylglycohydrolase family protein [Desulfobacterales bacterium]
MDIINKIKSCLYGSAFGDSLGGLTEFSNVSQILERWPPNGPEELQGCPACVTDDTQMALALAEALIEASEKGRLRPENVEPEIRKYFVQWNDSPDNTRAPGMTCMNACENLKRNIRWQDATIKNSKGCGANMRVAPVALLPPSCFESETDRAALAQYQAAFTHGHATALAASDLTCFTVNKLLNGEHIDNLVKTIKEYAFSQKYVYHHKWLDDLWERPGVTSSTEYIARGWYECIAVLDNLEKALDTYDYQTDPCELTGNGWIAEEAFSTGLLCFLVYPDNPLKALNRAAVTRGDSDSIACLTGAFAGAYHDIGIWPQEWLSKIEYKNRIDNISDKFAKFA